MNFTDAHTHITALSLRDIERMSLMGIRRVVSPVQLGTKRPLAPETILDVWDGQLEKQLPRCEHFYVKPYAMIGISMVATPSSGLDMLLNKLGDYLSKPQVKAIGEVGFEPGSASNKDADYQRGLLKEQLAIAAQYHKAIDIHTPNADKTKIKATEDTLSLCREVGIDMSKVIIDHCSEANLQLVLDAGANAAISIQPWRKITPELAAEWVMRFGAERVMLDSDSSELYSEPLSVAYTAFQLRKKGAAEEVIQAVCDTNAAKVYGLDS